MNTTTHTAAGKFAPGNRANPRGRPTNEQRMQKVIERVLSDAGASPEDIARLTRAAGNKLDAALAIGVLVAAVTERREQSYSGPGVPHPPGTSRAQ